MDNKLKLFCKKFLLVFTVLIVALSFLSSCDYLDELDIEGDVEAQLPVSGQNMAVHFIDERGFNIDPIS